MVYREQVLDQPMVILWVEIKVVLRSSKLMLLFHMGSPRGTGGPSGFKTL